VGNILLKDEGIGVHVAYALQKLAPPEGVDLEIIDGGTSPDVFLTLQRVDKLIIIDAARGSDEPGTIYRFYPDDLASTLKGTISVHQVSFLHILKVMDYLGFKPKDTAIFGIEPKEIDWGLKPSAQLQQKIPQIVKLVLEEVHSTLR
jgi:hydrogenase maturation protease